MSRLDELEKTVPISRQRLIGGMVCGLIAMFLVWAYFAELEEVAIADGEVIPQGQIKVIQHLEGGIIEEIFVREGDAVVTGDALVQLDLMSARTNKQELEVNLDGLLLQRARLEAEADEAPLSFPDDLAARLADLAQSEMRAFEGRRQELASTLGVLREQVRQKESEIQQLDKETQATRTELALARQEFEISASLIVDGLTSRVDHLRLEREVEELEGRLAALGPAHRRGEAALAEARERAREAKLGFRRQALELLSQNEREVARLRESLARAADQAERTQIVSPIDGVVKSLRYNTIGGVVSPGESIMEIVPTADRLIIEGKLDPRDIGYVWVGQEAVVKVSTYDFARYGGLNGKVIYLSADSYTTQEGRTYFRVQAETDKTFLGPEPGILPISPGMQATIDIHTGRKAVITYMLKPVLRLKSEAFRER
ncbi:MAG: HlyD family type I secretion periplasmic adaptor subunit [Alphaproteobacteria bacterium]|jgi:adhesin transport system membrane fusion protein|nr:HlyD family type I secretion periplasmic adaptor subunit [Alphaproteobacteria bacterium]MDP6516391.1 HlyD family type I secretion periplasmic adaptor subunit [Alphaproteobacteria bacterium]